MMYIHDVHVGKVEGTRFVKDMYWFCYAKNRCSFPPKLFTLNQVNVPVHANHLIYSRLFHTNLISLIDISSYFNEFLYYFKVSIVACCKQWTLTILIEVINVFV